MAPIAGHRSAIKTVGTSTAMTNEACTMVSSTVYRITSTSRRVLDPTVAVTVNDNGSPVAAANVTIDYLFGTVTRTGGSFTGPVTVTANYLPLLDVAEGVAWSVSMTRTELDKTVFGNTDKAYLLGLKTAEGTFELLDLPSTDLDAGGGTVKLEEVFGNDTAKLLEVTLNPDGTPVYWRGWVRWAGIDLSAPLDELVKASHKWRATSFQGSGQSEYASFGVG